MKEFIVIPELEIEISDREKELEAAVIKEKKVPYNLVTEVFCRGFRSRQTKNVIGAFYYTLEKYREKRVNAPLAEKSSYLRDEEKPKEIHPIRSAEYVKAADGTPLDIAVTFLHDLPEDLADEPREMSILLNDIEKNFGYAEYANIYALQNKHQLLVKHLEKHNITDPERIKKRLRKFRSRNAETRRAFKYQSRTLEDALKHVESDPSDILYKLRKKTYSQYLINSQNYIFGRHADNKGFSLLTTPIAKTGERIDNTKTMYFRKKEKKTDVILRNCEVLEQNMGYIKRGITNPCFEELIRRLIYISLRKIYNEIKFLEFDLDVDTEPVHTEFSNMYDSMQSRYGKFLLKNIKNGS